MSLSPSSACELGGFILVTPFEKCESLQNNSNEFPEVVAKRLNITAFYIGFDSTRLDGPRRRKEQLRNPAKKQHSRYQETSRDQSVWCETPCLV